MKKEDNPLCIYPIDGVIDLRVEYLISIRGREFRTAIIPLSGPQKRETIRFNVRIS